MAKPTRIAIEGKIEADRTGQPTIGFELPAGLTWDSRTPMSFEAEPLPDCPLSPRTIAFIQRKIADMQYVATPAGPAFRRRPHPTRAFDPRTHRPLA